MTAALAFGAPCSSAKSSGDRQSRVMGCPPSSCASRRSSTPTTPSPPLPSLSGGCPGVSVFLRFWFAIAIATQVIGPGMLLGCGASACFAYPNAADIIIFCNTACLSLQALGCLTHAHSFTTAGQPFTPVLAAPGWAGTAASAWASRRICTQGAEQRCQSFSHAPSNPTSRAAAGALSPVAGATGVVALLRKPAVLEISHKVDVVAAVRPAYVFAKMTAGACSGRREGTK